MNTESSSQIFEALLREGSVAAKILGSGATLLRQVRPGNVAALNMALFNLSIGLERAGKIAFVVDSYLRNSNHFPSDAQLRKFGHNIEEIFTKLIDIAHRYPSEDGFAIVPASPIHRAIIHCLSEFAQTTRYYNLDFIVGGRSFSSPSPEDAWFGSVGRLILQEYPKPSLHSTSKHNSDDLQREYARKIVIVSTPNGPGIRDLRSHFEHQQEVTFIQRKAQLHTLQIIRFFAATLSNVQHAAHRGGLASVPFFDEQFAYFFNDDAYLKSRKTWLF